MSYKEGDPLLGNGSEREGRGFTGVSKQIKYLVRGLLERDTPSVSLIYIHHAQPSSLSITLRPARFSFSFSYNFSFSLLFLITLFLFFYLRPYSLVVNQSINCAKQNWKTHS